MFEIEKVSGRVRGGFKLMEGEKNVCVINKTEKVIGINGNTFDYKNLVVQGLTMEETKRVFDEEWKIK